MIERLRNSTRGGASPVTARARRSRATFVWAWALAGSIPVISAFAAAGPAGQTPDDANRPPGRLVFCGAADNDLVRVAAECGILAERFDAPEQAVQAAPDGSGLLILADGYPQKTTEVSPAVFDDAAKKGLRVYVEYPASLPGLEIGKPKAMQLERVVVASDAFGEALEPMRIAIVNDCRLVEVQAPKPDLVAELVKELEGK